MKANGDESQNVNTLSGILSRTALHYIIDKHNLKQLLVNQKPVSRPCDDYSPIKYIHLGIIVVQTKLTICKLKMKNVNIQST